MQLIKISEIENVMQTNVGSFGWPNWSEVGLCRMEDGGGGQRLLLDGLLHYVLLFSCCRDAGRTFDMDWCPL